MVEMSGGEGNAQISLQAVQAMEQGGGIGTAGEGTGDVLAGGE